MDFLQHLQFLTSRDEQLASKSKSKSGDKDVHGHAGLAAQIATNEVVAELVSKTYSTQEQR
jgi:hypothetical protein